MDGKLARAPSTEKSVKQNRSSKDVESNEHSEDAIILESPEEPGVFRKLTRKLLTWGVETHGRVFAQSLEPPVQRLTFQFLTCRIEPIPESQRTDKRIYQLFLVWFSTNFNVLAFGTGSAGPAFFGLGLTSSLVVILIVDLITCAFPAFFSVFGPKLGMRGMVQGRFSWGLYAGAIPSALNVFSSQGFLILNCIIGGQTLAAVSDKIDDTLGIVIIAVIALVVTFFGYKFLHWFETFAWIPSVITFPILLGLAAKHLNPSSFPAVDPPTASQVLSFASLVASSVISWCTLTPDYGVYHDHNASSHRIFWYTYAGFFAPSLAWHMIGTAFAAAAPGIPSWQEGFDGGNNVGGLLMAILSPAGGFGKFLIVLLGLSTASACVPTMYTFGLSAIAVAPVFARVPRYIPVIISEAILIPLAIIGATKFYATLVDILSVIGYWSTAFACIVLTEHIIFRRGTWSNYDQTQWNQGRLLPPGIAAVLAFACAFGIIVPCMSQTWYTGPVARAGTGDIGVFTGGTVAVLSYAVFRSVEKRIWPAR